jgi:ribosomal protein S18 acetylase RimI-like enzyme
MERVDDILIVAPGPGDAGALARVHVAAWREAYTGLLPSLYLERMSVPWHARRWRAQLMSATSPEIVLAAEGPEGLVGYCSGRAQEEAGAAEVSTLYVISAAQKLGLGRRLLAAAARVLASRGSRSVSLWVLNGNDGARGFYEHLGGVAVAERAVRGWGGGFRETAMHWPDISRLTDEA